MILKNVIDEDFTNYKQCSMFLGFPKCTFKCEKECGKKMCQNSILATSPDIEISNSFLIKRYQTNPLTRAVVCGGLEPFDSWEELKEFIAEFRLTSNDTIVIYTGYNQEEIADKIMWLKLFPNIIVKFGRFVPDQEKHYDDTLGIMLASDNQYAERIS